MFYKNNCILGMSVTTNPDTLIEGARAIENKLIAEPQFNLLQPTPGEVMGVIDTLSRAQEECRRRNYQFIPERDSLRRQLVDMLKQQVGGTNSIAQGNLELLRLSGFPLEKDRGHRPLPHLGVMRNIKSGRSATDLVVEAQPLKGISSYTFEVLQANGVVITHISSRCRTVITGVAANTDVEVRVCGSNARGSGEWSQYLKFATPRVTESSADPKDKLKVA